MSVEDSQWRKIIVRNLIERNRRETNTFNEIIAQSLYTILLLLDEEGFLLSAGVDKYLCSSLFYSASQLYLFRITYKKNLKKNEQR